MEPESEVGGAREVLTRRSVAAEAPYIWKAV